MGPLDEVPPYSLDFQEFVQQFSINLWINFLKNHPTHVIVDSNPFHPLASWNWKTWNQPKCKVYNTVMKVVFITATCCWRFQKYPYTHFMMSCVETSQMDLRFDVTHGCEKLLNCSFKMFQMSLIVILGKPVFSGVHRCVASSNAATGTHFCASSSPSFLGCGTSFFEGRRFWTFQPLSIVMNKHPQDFRWNLDTRRCQDLLDLLDAAKAAHLPDIRKVRNTWGVTCEGVETLDESAAYFREFRWFKVQRFKPHIKCCHSFWRLVLICIRFDEVLHITVLLEWWFWVIRAGYLARIMHQNDQQVETNSTQATRVRKPSAMFCERH